MNEGASGKAITTLVFGILGLTTCPLLAIVAILLGKQDLLAIEQEFFPVADSGMARAGVICGYISVIPFLVALVASIGFLGIALLLDASRM